MVGIFFLRKKLLKVKNVDSKSKVVRDALGWVESSTWTFSSNLSLHTNLLRIFIYRMFNKTNFTLKGVRCAANTISVILKAQPSGCSLITSCLSSIYKSVKWTHKNSPFQALTFKFKKKHFNRRNKVLRFNIYNNLLCATHHHAYKFMKLFYTKLFHLYKNCDVQFIC